jgi:hypothetical protein
MFTVENGDFIADKLASELPRDQEFREAVQNEIEAIVRLAPSKGDGWKGRIEIDIDWAIPGLLDDFSAPKVCVAGNGDGMARAEISKYATTLAVEGANQNQGIRGNQGCGLKIAGPPRHRAGVLIRSLKGDEASMALIAFEDGEYGFQPLNSQGDLVLLLRDELVPSLFPAFIVENGSGTIVTFLGMTPDANTFKPAEKTANTWLYTYLQKRYFRIDDWPVEIKCRVPAGSLEDWPQTAEEATDRAKGADGKAWNLNRILGTGAEYNRVAGDGFGEDGQLTMAGELGRGIPDVCIHWWVIDDEARNRLTPHTNGPGSFATLFQNELHDWRTNNGANPWFARFGITVGKHRVFLVLEPLGDLVHSDFARARVLLDGAPVMEHEAIDFWASQFRQPGVMPPAIRAAVDQELQKLGEDDDPDRDRRIRKRLQATLNLFPTKRYRRSTNGSVTASGDVAGAGGVGDTSSARTTSVSGRGAPTASRSHHKLDALTRDGELAEEINPKDWIKFNWIGEEAAEKYTLVNANGVGFKDRAAALVGTDALTATELVLNRDFRVYRGLLEKLSEELNPHGDEALEQIIMKNTQEWIGQKMIESVLRIRQLQNGSTWLAEKYEDALSPVALTAAFLADLAQSYNMVKRAVPKAMATSA